MGFVCGELSRHLCSSESLFHRWRQAWISVALIGVVVSASPVEAQKTPGARPTSTATRDTEGQLQFSFEGARWREVLKWLANESDLALHVGDLPTGSFTYSDPNSFTHDEAIDRINLFLLPQGFTLVRSGKLLSVINLSDPRSMQQLNVLAKLVSLQQLDQLENHDVVKCFFPLGALKAEDAVEELSALKLMTTPAVFPKTNQLLITDTAGNLKNVKAVLDSFEPRALDNGTVVKSFALQHVDAEDILIVARPHMGLATGEMIGIDVSLSADVQGKNIFVTGIEDKVKLIEGLIKAIDKPKKTSASGKPELRAHIVEGGNVELVYNVLQTLLAGKTVRLSVDEASSSIVALATPDIQNEIAQTVTQLQASEAIFEVIQLKSVDPYFAISLLEEMLDLEELERRASASLGAFSRGGDSRDRSRGDSRDRSRGNSRSLGTISLNLDVPKIDADPGNMRLFVRAKKQQMEQIKKIIAELDVGSGIGESDDEIRIFPLKGKQAIQVLETAARFWRGENLIILYPSTVKNSPEDTERVVAGNSTITKLADVSEAKSVTSSGRVLAGNIRSQKPSIRCQLTPRGLLLHSDDTEALDQFFKQLRTIAGPVDSMPSPPIVFYLKYTKPDDAIRMLSELLDGGESASEGEAGSLVNGYVSGASGSFFGSLVSSRDGTTTMTAGTITVVADSRLNRLIAQGTASDIERIESYLKIVDKDNSITSIETYGTSHVIELSYGKASEVAAVIRDAYAGRVSGATSGRQPGQSGSPQQGSREAAPARESQDRGSGERQQGSERKASPKKSASQAARDLEPKMTIAVHEPSNSLIVTAPDQLFKEVEQLAKLIDLRCKQTILVVPATHATAQLMLLNAFSGKANPSSGKAKSSSPSLFPSRSLSPARSLSPKSSPLQIKNGR